MIRALFKKIIEAVKACHEKKVFHFDLKADNIMVKPDESIVLIDFGMAQMKTDTDADQIHCSNILGRVSYMPIDVVESEGKSSFICAAIDMYSLGCILYMMKFRETFDPNKLANKIESLKGSDPSLAELINGLTDKDISKRWTMEQTEQSVWLRPLYTFKIYTEDTEKSLKRYKYTLINSTEQLDRLYEEGKLSEYDVLSTFIKNIRDAFLKLYLTDVTELFILEKFFYDDKEDKRFLYGTSFTKTEDENIKDIVKHGFRKKIKQPKSKRKSKQPKSKRKSLKQQSKRK